MINVLAALALLVLAPPKHPAPALSPSQVVGIVLHALQHNDDPRPDAGIATTFEFASPANREETGPLERFALMIKNPDYRPMLGFRSASRGPIQIDGNHARQRVVLVGRDGSEVTYMFLLSKQADGPYAHCWMTDGVIRQQAPEPLPGTTAT
jgi:Domain of unknown function (DUF4864)